MIRNPDLCFCLTDQDGYPGPSGCPYDPPCKGQCKRFGMDAILVNGNKTVSVLGAFDLLNEKAA